MDDIRDPAGSMVTGSSHVVNVRGLYSYSVASGARDVDFQPHKRAPDRSVVGPITNFQFKIQLGARRKVHHEHEHEKDS